MALATRRAATALAASGAHCSTPVPNYGQNPLYSRALLIIFGMRMTVIFMTTTAKLGHEARLFPRWFVFGRYGVAAALFLVATLSAWLAIVFPLWVLVLNGIIWFHGPTITQESPASASPL